MSKRRHFAGNYPSGKGDKKMQDEITSDIRFLELIKERRYQEAIEIMPEVVDINAPDPETGAAPIHIAAGRRATILLSALWTRDDLDELRRDAQGRYPSEVAWHVGGDEQLSEKLMEREHAYAKAHGLVAWPKPDPAQPPTPD